MPCEAFRGDSSHICFRTSQFSPIARGSVEMLVCKSCGPNRAPQIGSGALGNPSKPRDRFAIRQLAHLFPGDGRGFSLGASSEGRMENGHGSLCVSWNSGPLFQVGKKHGLFMASFHQWTWSVFSRGLTILSASMIVARMLPVMCSPDS